MDDAHSEEGGLLSSNARVDPQGLASARAAIGNAISLLRGRTFGDVALIFTLFSLRILITPLWTSPFVPVVSPVFWQGHRWIETSLRTAAIITHVISGGIMLVCAAAQFDSGLRRRRPRLHRWTGRCYFLSGCACIGALRFLLSSVGQGKGSRPDPSMVLFVNVASAMWLAATIVAVYYIAVRRDYQAHKTWMIRSVYYALVPVFQRAANFFPLSILAMGWQMCVDAMRCIPFYQSRWGGGTGDWTLAISLDSGGEQSDENRPLVLSFTGYGVAEHLVFSVSAWTGLFVAALFAEFQCRELASSSSSWEPFKSARSQLLSVFNATAAIPTWQMAMVGLAVLAGLPIGITGLAVFVLAVFLPIAITVLSPLIFASYLLYLGTWFSSAYLGAGVGLCSAH